MPTHITHTYEDTLQKIEQNDNTLTGLYIGDDRRQDGYYILHTTAYRTINTRDSFSRVGKSIGKNTHLKNLVFSSVGIELDVTHREFFEGLTRNNSIKKVNLQGGNDVIRTEVFHEILKSYQSNSNNLVDLFIKNTRLLQNGGDHVLALTLKACPLWRGAVYPC